MSDEQEDATTYRAVVNAEEQYSLWPAGKDLPLGWREAGHVGGDLPAPPGPAGFSGPKADCLAYIKERWTDMRPLSLRT